MTSGRRNAFIRAQGTLACTHARTDGRTTRKHTALSRIYRVGKGIKIIKYNTEKTVY